MKKNFAMRIAACLLVVTMLSLCMVSYTYAKYTTADDATDSAQVAKWGVVVETKLDDLFETAYDNASGTVQAAGSYNILAPGTKDNQAAAFAITGTPEVKVNVNVDVNVDLGSNWKLADDSVYCPLIIKVNAVEFKIDATNTTTAKLEEAIEEAIRVALGHGDHEAKSNLTKTVEVSWEWPFEVDGDQAAKDANNAKDTYLGNQAEAGKAPKFALTIEVTVSQLD